ncbi:LysR family transcriptional regulator substrate-binding protein [Streptomyces sp. DSM 41534]
MPKGRFLREDYHSELAVMRTPAMDMIRGFMLDHPEVEFEIVDGAADDVVERLARGTVELGLTAHGDLQDSFCFEPLPQEQFYGSRTAAALGRRRSPSHGRTSRAIPYSQRDPEPASEQSPTLRSASTQSQ